MSPKRHERTQSRRIALQVLYAADIQNTTVEAVMETKDLPTATGMQHPASFALVEKISGDASIDILPAYALKLIRGVATHVSDLDAYVASVSENWALERISSVDMEILHIAVYEMKYVAEVPVSVAINEAVDLAKEFGGEDESPKFVNGILGKIALVLENEAATKGTTCR